MTDANSRAFALTAAQERLLAEVRALARDVLAPLARAGRPGRVNRELVRALGEHGLLARLLPSEPSAPGAQPRHPLPAGPSSATELCLLREALARESTAAETALALQGLGAHPIAVAGADPVRRRWLPAVAAGEAVAAFALSEPGAGSDAAALALRAEPDGGGFRLSGTKTWISNAPDADVYTLFARTTPGARSRGITAFAVPGDAPGLAGEPLELLGGHAVGRLELDGVPVAAEQVLGQVDQGFGLAMRTLDRFRPSVGAFAVGMAQAALDAAVEHAASRQAFGRPLREHQAVAHALADMATRTQAARLLVYAAAGRYDADPDGPGVTQAAAMAKLYATEAAQRVVDQAVQLLGARALERGHLLEHLYREVRAPRIYEGTSEIQRTVIARELFRGREGPAGTALP
ncbi:MAG TPA: acyl-CoA dehydrogenase family protein [Actinomycetota bacterium]|nr:acyl-CoA dehydrogenase family protein [Actinomycetota bacterium]